MIDLHRLAKILPKIQLDEIQVLQTLEEITHRFEYVPPEEIQKRIAIDAEDVLFLLSKLNKRGLIQRTKKRYLGYRLSQMGFDALALYELAQKDVILSIGQPYGEGKEATVYRALDAMEKEVAVKFLRWGRSSFRSVRRLRTLKDEGTFSWMDLSKRAANREFSALRKLQKVGGQVPHPIAVNRHVIVMSKISGQLLLDVMDFKKPQIVFERIIQQVKLAYEEAEIVHGDLSEYNIFVDEEDQIILFDWPQWQPLTHPNALWLLKRDITNVATFFRRRFRLQYDVNEILETIIASSERKRKND
ncbi:MAG: RIO1 family regulatory kinase/ATPase [Candidatus Thorarchaeota archaeon]